MVRRIEDIITIPQYILQYIDPSLEQQILGLENFQIACPLHGGTNPTSFSYKKGDDGKGIFSCWSKCKIYGKDVVEFHRAYKNLSKNKSYMEVETDLLKMIGYTTLQINTYYENKIDNADLTFNKDLVEYNIELSKARRVAYKNNEDTVDFFEILTNTEHTVNDLIAFIKEKKE